MRLPRSAPAGCALPAAVAATQGAAQAAVDALDWLSSCRRQQQEEQQAMLCTLHLRSRCLPGMGVPAGDIRDVWADRQESFVGVRA